MRHKVKRLSALLLMGLMMVGTTLNSSATEIGSSQDTELEEISVEQSVLA